MSDKTQLERVTKLITEYGNATFDCGEWQSEADGDYDGLLKIAYSKRVEIAQQILDICQPQWMPVDGQNPFEVLTDETKGRVIFRFFHGKDYWTLEPPPPEDTA